jgi:Domain of unknown function (DUF4360)
MRKLSIIGGTLLAMAAMTLTATPAHAKGYLGMPVPPPSDHIVIDVITVNGSGCPAGTAAIAVSPDNTAFTVTYSQYIAQVGVGALATDWRKNCQLSLAVHVPSGFTYAVAEADYRGFASLMGGATSLERANYYFQGMPQTTQVTHNFSGPLADDWQATDVNDIASLVYAPCGALRNFNINTELRVSGGTSDLTKTTSFMTMDSTDGSFSTLYHFAWMTCP